MEFWIVALIIQLVLVPFYYQHYKNLQTKASSHKPPQSKRVLQSDKYKAEKPNLPPTQRRSPPLSPPKTGVQMVGGRAVLIKPSASAPPPPPPPSIHSKLNPLKPAPAPSAPQLGQRVPQPIPQQETLAVDVPTLLLQKLDAFTYDREISTRLVMTVAKKNPDRDGRWCAEKALWDISRDRY